MILYFNLLILITLHNGHGYVFKSQFENEDIYCLFDRVLNIDVTKIRTNFYDFRNNHSSVQLLKNAFVKITNYPHWDPSRRFTVFVPSFRSNSKGIACKWVRESFNNVPDKYLLIVDYSAYSNKLSARGIEKAIPFGYHIGKATTLLLVELFKAKIAAKNIHLIGHGFGGQIVGYIGEIFKNKTEELVGRITSIDPVKTCFEEDTEEEHIRKGIAEYLEVYHCSKKCTDKTLGDVDIFFNKNSENQPGCHDGVAIGNMKNLTADWCDHYNCLKFWTDTITEPERYSCCAAPAYIGGVCHGKGDGIAGYHNTGNVRGVMYASTVERSKSDEL